MKTIKLPHGRVVLVDDEDYDRVNNYKWCTFKNGNTYYAQSYAQGRYLYMHHLIIGKPTKDFVTDHIDGNGLNNQRDNLRIISRRENAYYAKRATTSIYPGVSWNKGMKKWTARLYHNKKYEYLGCFKEELKAHEAYEQARAEIAREEESFPLCKSRDELKNLIKEVLKGAKL